MSLDEVIQAWKDEDYRNNLTDKQLSDLPENPAGDLDLTFKEMESIAGGFPTATISFTHTYPCCGSVIDL